MNGALIVDGKVVRNFLFARLSRLSPHPVLIQVEAFDLDHAAKRLNELRPGFKWELIEELDPEHDVGALGSKLPLSPLVLPARRRIQ